MNLLTGFRLSMLCLLSVVLFAAPMFAQTNGDPAKPATTVVKVDDESIVPLLKPNGKPLFVNFWATWCVPCVEEFPLLVNLHEEYKGKIDFITISLDYLAEINRDVPKFLTEQKATMPAYLLYTKDENKVIGAISKEWSGGLPFSIYFGTNGETLYSRQGIVKPEVLKPIIDASLVIEECEPTG